jgi:hypothetical protein
VTPPLSRGQWDQTIVPPFRALYAEYAASFHGVAKPERRRPHFAGQNLTLDEAVIRWMLPPLYPAEVGDGVDAVFLDGAAIAGMAPIVRARMLPACRALLERIQPKSSCGDAVWQHVVDAVGGSDRAEHSCRLAVSLCGIASP